MGSSEHIDVDKFPRQREEVGEYSGLYMGDDILGTDAKIVRWDAEEPREILYECDGKYFQGSELVVDRGYRMNSYPVQTEDLGKLVDVYFQYDMEKHMDGRIVRQDKAAPYLTVIRLDNGNYVLGHEIEFRPKNLID